jgi:predicted O-linked N-acetylglucosamine transferase (SPINDLY family)
MDDSADVRQRALQYAGSGRLEAARELLEHLLDEDGDDAQAWFLLAAVNGQLGDLAAVITCSRRAIDLDAECVDAYFNLAQAHMHLRQYRAAREAFEQVLVRQPRHPVALSNLGYLLNMTGEYQAAVDCLEAARRIRPEDAEILNNLGNAYSGLAQVSRAITCYEAAVRLVPGMAMAWNNLAAARRRAGQYLHALDKLDRALELAPDYVDALINKGLLLQLCGQAEQADTWFSRALELAPDMPRAISAYLFNLNYFQNDAERVYAEHVRHAARIAGDASVHEAEAGRVEDDAIRVGFVSPDLREHSVAYFFSALCRGHDRKRMKLFCYADVARRDTMTKRIRETVHAWRDISGLLTREAAGLIRRDRLDVVVDLAGHTEPRVMEILATRVAPVQVTWLGYPNTTGLATMDYRITDDRADPVGVSEPCHSERLLRLQGGFLCYQPPADLPEVSLLPADRAGHITFGSFNSLAKMTPRVIGLWSRILHAVPGSRLLLKNRTFSDEGVRNRVRDMFVAHGIDARRLELVGFVPGNEHFGLYGRMDIALDSFPYNGTTTTCEALWMGVPVVTLAGCMHPGRVGVSLLGKVGLEEWVARDEEEYLAVAIRHAADLTGLQALRSGMRDRLLASGLCDHRAFSAEMEEVLRGLCNGSVTARARRDMRH